MNVRGALIGLGSYATYAVIVGVVFTRVVSAMLPDQVTPAPQAPPWIVADDYLSQDVDRHDVSTRASAANIVVTLTVVTGDGVDSTVHCRTTADRVASDTLLVLPGDVGEVYKQLGCK